jgi:hypothetical protein
MMRLLLLVVCCVFFSVNASAKKIEVTLGKIKLMNALIEIKIPSHFSALLDHELKTHYNPEALPKAAYADSLREVRLAFYSVKNKYTDAGMGAIRASFLSDFMESDLKLKELSGGLTEIDGREAGYMSILHKSPKKYYRFYFLTIYKGMILAGELISPKKGYKNWLQPAVDIMNSLHIKAD